MLNRLGLVILIVFAPYVISAQSDIDAELAAFEAALDELDSASLISMLDSLIRQSDTPLKSQLGVRVGYNSQLINAGRDLGLNQFGFSFGAAYYHKSGAFMDLAGYTNSVSDPSYYLNLLSTGYLGQIGNHWGFSLSYDHYFYNDDQNGEQDIQIYSNGFNTTLFTSGRKIDTGIDYSAILGDTLAAHRLTWFITGNINIKNFWFFDRLTIMPTANMLFGNSTSYLFNITRNESDLTLRERFRLLNDDDPRNDPGRINIEEGFPNTFGLLNYGLSIPIALRKGNLSFLASYTYNIPVELPGQSEDLVNSGFISLNASYFFQL
ncbi:MAG: hypothetical protein AAF693_13650 [Bacteroidota bacterium]